MNRNHMNIMASPYLLQVATLRPEALHRSVCNELGPSRHAPAKVNSHMRHVVAGLLEMRQCKKRQLKFQSAPVGVGRRAFVRSMATRTYLRADRER